jgi:hypothetical protein
MAWIAGVHSMQTETSPNGSQTAKLFAGETVAAEQSKLEDKLRETWKAFSEAEGKQAWSEGFA